MSHYVGSWLYENVRNVDSTYSFCSILYNVFLKGYNYNERLRRQDQKGRNYITPNDSWLDEFFRIVVPYFPVNIAKFF